MKSLEEILQYNEKFVEEKKYEEYETGKFPNKKMVIISCMDTRLVELLPKAMNMRNGDVKIIKVAGAVISHPFGSIMRSILVAVYELGADEVCVVGHHDCGMTKIQASSTIEKMKERGVTEEKLDTLRYSGIDLEKFLGGFPSSKESVKHSVSVLRNHPLLPAEVPVHGLVIHPDTGKLDLVVNGYEA
ncbi:carbonic anhydrase [Bacillus sp. DX1.1]|uniref:beta-class carbonic anhydrase n=1 Tax=unclassified Bacillus (in: firmicutes) TaxID=185979 RepID=UPI00256FF3EA|nr:MULTISPECIES: carbonic anhydrase [unclassified Bacillus (in: firmicutes)]MDM5156954.1 carbonic anhydrase [Bacillus sp. DX1.1]WJE81195.1 carbonic anhydrase [Bacillus sp. DX3.1]